MIHGDLKGVRSNGLNYPAISPSLLVKANILIDQTGHARLADFGLLTVISDSTNLLASSSYTQGGTARWMSPELIAPQRFGFESSRPTKSSDCYALGMVIFETISGRLPFYTCTDLTVFVKVLEGEHPRREAGFADSLWEMLELCWAPQPDARPGIEDVLHCLERSPQSGGFSSRLDGEADGGGGWDSGSDSSSMFSPPPNISHSQCVLLACVIFIQMQRQKPSPSIQQARDWCPPGPAPSLVSAPTTNNSNSFRHCSHPISPFLLPPPPHYPKGHQSGTPTPTYSIELDQLTTIGASSSILLFPRLLTMYLVPGFRPPPSTGRDV